MELIDKAAVVAEIERLQSCTMDKNMNFYSEAAEGEYYALSNLESFLDTLEVKDVDLDEYARHYLLYEHISPLNGVLHQADIKVEMQYHKDIEDAYKAGFKLGLKAKKVE